MNNSYTAMTTVTIKGWRVGLRKVSMTQALRTHCGLGLADAKSVTDRVLIGEVVEIQAPDSETAHQLVAELTELGADAAVGEAV
jgi:ribosomal protein L7/L12